jgi:hypothetical protein
MDVAPLIYGEFQISFKQRAYVSSMFGLIVLVIAWLLDQVTTLDWSFWLYLFGGLSFSCGLIWYFNDEVSVCFCFDVVDVVIINHFVKPQYSFFGIFSVCC